MLYNIFIHRAKSGYFYHIKEIPTNDYTYYSIRERNLGIILDIILRCHIIIEDCRVTFKLSSHIKMHGLLRKFGARHDLISCKKIALIIYFISLKQEKTNFIIFFYIAKILDK